MRKTCALVIVGALLSAGCKTNDPYADLTQEPIPSTEGQRTAECSAIRSEIARQQSFAQMGTVSATSPMMAVAMQSVARKHIAELQSRSSQIQCDVIRIAPTQPVVSSPPPPTQAAPTMSLDQCFTKCRELTSRTEAECFDACRH